MASKVYQAHRRIRYRQRKKAQRAAALASAGNEAQPNKDNEASLLEPTDSGEKGKGCTAQKSAAPSNKHQPASKPSKTPTQQPGIKTIDLRQRVRLVERTVAWMYDGFGREAGKQARKLDELMQSKMLSQANVLEIRNEIAQQKVATEKLRDELQLEVATLQREKRRLQVVVIQLQQEVAQLRQEFVKMQPEGTGT